MCFRCTETLAGGYPPIPQYCIRALRLGPSPRAMRTLAVLEAEVRSPKFADDSAPCRLHDLGHIVIQPGHHPDHFRFGFRARQFLRQIEQ